MAVQFGKIYEKSKFDEPLQLYIDVSIQINKFVMQILISKLIFRVISLLRNAREAVKVIDTKMSADVAWEAYLNQYKNSFRFIIKIITLFETSFSIYTVVHPNINQDDVKNVQVILHLLIEILKIRFSNREYKENELNYEIYWITMILNDPKYHWEVQDIKKKIGTVHDDPTIVAEHINYVFTYFSHVLEIETFNFNFD